MKQTIKLPLYSIYSLIQDMDEMAENPATAKQFKNMQDALNMLKETFMPLINEFKECLNIPDIDATVYTESEEGNDTGDKQEYEDRRFELIKAVMQARITALEKNFNFRSMMPSIAKESIKMADIMMEEIRRQSFAQ